jgi:GAF domain-containing protein/anti-sigma regulatory factor (Ser/Thr protein kinase)
MSNGWVTDTDALSILLISRNQSLAATIASSLADEPAATAVPHYHVTHHPDLPAALFFPTHLILLDLDPDAPDPLMPLRLIRERLPLRPICVLVATTHQSLGEAALQQGAANYLLYEELDGPLLGRFLTGIYRQAMAGYTAILPTAIGTPSLHQLLAVDDLLDHILELIAQTIPYDVASIQLLYGREARVVRLRLQSGLETLEELRRRVAVLTFDIDQVSNLREVVETRRPFVLPDVQAYEAWVNFDNGLPFIGSWVGAPMLYQGEILGLVTVDKTEPGFYHREHGDQLALYANQAALALRNAGLYEETRRQLEELSVLHTVANACTEATSVDDLFFETTAILARKLYKDHFGFLLVSADGQLHFHPSYHMRLTTSRPVFVPRDAGLMGWVLHHGRSRLAPDVSKESDYLAIDPHTASQLCVPLKLHQKIVGVINAESIHLDNFNRADEQLLVTLGQQLATIIEKIRLLNAERQRRQEAETLREAAAALTSSLDLGRVLEQILVQLEKVVPNDSSALMLFDNDQLRIETVRGFLAPDTLIGQRFPADDPFFMQVKESRQPICLANASTDPRFRNWGSTDTIQGWICAPLIVQDRVVGVLTVDSQHPAAYSESDMMLAQAFANQAAVAIDNARLYETAQKAGRHAEILRATNEALTQSLNTDMVLETLIDFLVQLIPVDSACILLLEENGDYVRPYILRSIDPDGRPETLEQIRINIHTNLTLQPIFAQRQSVKIDDTRLDPHWELFTPTAYVRSWLGAPISAGDKVIGAFSLDKATPGFFTLEHVRLVETMTAQATVALQNARLFAEVERRADELETITQISTALRLTDAIDDMLPIILEHIAGVVDASFCSIYLIEPETNSLVLKACHPMEASVIGHRRLMGQGITGYVAKSGRVYSCRNVWQDPLFIPYQSQSPWLKQLRTCISLPLQTRDRVIGVIHVNMNHFYDFSRQEINLLTAVSEIAASALARAMLLDTLEERVNTRTYELAEANESLKELDRLKSKFVADVSHELRTPVTNLHLYLDLLEQGKADKREQYQKTLRQQTERLTSLIEAVLQIARLDTDRVTMSFAAVDLNSLIRERLNTVRSKAAAQGLQLITDLDMTLPWVWGDNVQLEKVVDQLLANAIQYTLQGQIWLHTWLKDAQVCLAVRDSGLGIPPHDLSHIFDRFYRGSNVSQSTMPGSGLGLSLVKEILERHNGQVQVESVLGSGSNFTICLPAAV